MLYPFFTQPNSKRRHTLSYTLSYTLSGLTVTLRITPPATPVTVTWGDGSSDQTLTHTYAAAGVYTVAITATNAYGTVVVNLTAPVPNVSGATVSVSGLIATLTLHNTGGTIASTSTAWGDGATDGSLTHTYASAGVYTVVITAANAGGTSTASLTVLANSIPMVLVGQSRSAGLLFSDQGATVPVDAAGSSVQAARCPVTGAFYRTPIAGHMLLQQDTGGNWYLDPNGASLQSDDQFAFDATEPMALFFAGKITGDDQCLIGVGRGGASPYRYLLSIRGNWYFGFYADPDWNTGQPYTAGNTTHVARVVTADRHDRWQVGGTEYVRSTAGGVVATGSSPVCVGAIAGGSCPLSGRIYAAGLMRADLPDAQRDAVRAYLQGLLA